MNLKKQALSNGIALEYAEQGDPAGPVLICLHGYTDSCRSFELAFPYLPSHLYAVAVTLRGHGRSDRPPDGYRISDLAHDIALFMEAKGIGSAVILGHSLGSSVAQRFALDYPQKTKAVILVASFASYPANAAVAEMKEPVEALHDPVDPQFVEDFQRSTVARPVDPRFMQTAISESLQVLARVWQAVFAGMEREDYTSELRSLHQPVWLIWGTLDTIATSWDQQQLQSSIAGAQLLVYEGTGHAIQWEEPERFAHDVAGIVKDVQHAFQQNK
jgi:non-heme chloroperoxidase